MKVELRKLSDIKPYPGNPRHNDDTVAAVDTVAALVQMTAGKQPQPRGVTCPRCDCRRSYVIYTRHRQEHILRLRECRSCGRRWTTRER